VATLTGISGSFEMEWMAAFVWSGWQLWTGIRTFTIRRRKYITNPENLTRMEKIGCKFTRITPAFENTIQRYMQQIERETRQKN